MKLLFDQNLIFKLCRKLADLFPDSNHIRLLGLEEGSDRTIWEYAKTNGFTIVSQDVDFADMATLYGPPPRSFCYVAVISPQQIEPVYRYSNACSST